MAKTFIDTNIFIYALDGRDRKKQQTARRWISELESRGEAVVSTQVLQEFFNAATRKLGHDGLKVKPILQRIGQNELAHVGLATIEEAIDLTVLNSISFWDALVVSAAAEARCAIVLTEDLQAGKRIKGVEFVNPFAS